HEEALARVTRPNTPWFDRHDHAMDALDIRQRDLHRLRCVLERHALEPAALVDIADEVLRDRMQSRRKHDAHVPGQILRERLFGFGADDRIEFLVLLVALHEAAALERLGLDVDVATRRTVRKTKAVEADATLKWLSAQRTDLTLFEIERGIL